MVETCGEEGLCGVGRRSSGIWELEEGHILLMEQEGPHEAGFRATQGGLSLSFFWGQKREGW